MRVDREDEGQKLDVIVSDANVLQSGLTLEESLKEGLARPGWFGVSVGDGLDC